MLISMPTKTSTIFGAFQVICSLRFGFDCLGLQLRKRGVFGSICSSRMASITIAAAAAALRPDAPSPPFPHRYGTATVPLPTGTVAVRERTRDLPPYCTGAVLERGGRRSSAPAGPLTVALPASRTPHRHGDRCIRRHEYTRSRPLTSPCGWMSERSPIGAPQPKASDLAKECVHRATRYLKKAAAYFAKE
jgi:hypothetical protein